MIDKFSEIKIESSVDKIIRQLKSLIVSGDLNPGDTLPPERLLAEKLGVGRSAIRDAIKKLEFYGIVKTLPQSGTVIKGTGLVALEGLIIDILNFEETDFASLVDTRNLLEIESAGRAANRRTEQDISMIKEALEAFEYKIAEGDSAEEEDFLLHLQIAEVSGNSVLKTLMRIITPDILKNFKKRHFSKEERNNAILTEHREIVDQIIAQNAKGASDAMRNHLKGISDLCNMRF